MTAEQLGIGLVGPGGIGRVHVDSIRRIPEANLVAIAASTAEKARLISRKMRIPFAYDDYRSLIDNQDVQVVHICTRNRSHYAIAKHALAAGKHVVCEKPLAMSSGEAAELVRSAAEAGIVDAVCYNYRFYPTIQHLRAMIRAGELGVVHSVHGSYLQDWLLLEDVYNWRLNPDESGPSCALFDIGTHWLDLARFLTGLEVTAVSADLRTTVPERLRTVVNGDDERRVAKEKVTIASEDHAAVLIDFDGRAGGSLLVSQVAPGHKNRLIVEINGTRASAAWDSERPNELWVGYRKQRNHLMLCEASILDPAAKATLPLGGGHTFGILDSHFHLIQAIYKQIQQQPGTTDQPEPTFARFVDGHRDVATVEAILASNQCRGWVKVK